MLDYTPQYRPRDSPQNFQDVETVLRSNSSRTIANLQKRLLITQDRRQRQRILELILEAQENSYLVSCPDNDVLYDSEVEASKAALQLWKPANAALSKTSGLVEHHDGALVSQSYSDKVFKMLQRQHEESTESIQTIAAAIERLRCDLVDYLGDASRSDVEKLHETESRRASHCTSIGPSQSVSIDTKALLETCLEAQSYSDFLEKSHDFALSAAKYCMLSDPDKTRGRHR